MFSRVSQISKKNIIAIIKIYQKLFSGMKKSPTCRFIPTCSEYAILAVEKYGVLKGLYKAILRILKCNPKSDFKIDYP